MNATKKLSQIQKLTNPKNLNHGPKDAIDSHMGTQLVELNETTCWIFKIKKISKIFKDHAKRTSNQQIKHV